MGLMSYSTEFTFNAPIKILFRAVQEAMQNIKRIKSVESFENQNIIIAMTKMRLGYFGEKIEVNFNSVDDLNTKILITSSGTQFELHQNKDNCINIIYETKKVLLSSKYRELIETGKAAVSKNSVSQDLYGELIKLKKLHDAGIISDIEFENKKQDLLSQLQ